MRHFALTVGMTILLGPALAGCGGGGGGEFDPNDVDQTYGAITTTDDAPMFGEAGTFGEEGAADADPAATDALATDPAVPPAEQAAKKIHFLALAWGHVRAATDETLDKPAAKDFSGSLSISQGAVVVVRKLRMEPVQGDGVLPRTDVKLVEWKSTIYNGVDGLLLKLLGPEEATVTLKLAGQTVTKTLADLDLAQGGVEIPGTEDGLVWAAAAVNKGQGCAHGYLFGRWHRRVPRGGVFRGKWVGADGALHGHLRGIFGTRKNGDNVLFGKWISSDGAFKGLLAGTYGDNQFKGHYLDKALALSGRIGGVYFEPRILELRKMGILVGTWHEACPNEPLAAGETEVK
jgi:hypothetical protein